MPNMSLINIVFTCHSNRNFFPWRKLLKEEPRASDTTTFASKGTKKFVDKVFCNF